MNKIVTGLVAILFLASCQEQQKIGFIDNGEVINEYQMKKDIEKKFEGQNADFSKVRDSIAQVYQTEVQAIQVRLAKMSPQKQQEESQAFSQKWQPMQQQMQFQQQQMEQAFNTEMDSVISNVNDFVEKYGKDNGYTFILGKNQAGSVLYGKESSDITDEVTKAINEAYGVKDSGEGKEAETSEDDTETEE
ncbi:OmpH family outer membrane protein [Winogradskyella ursingii]|uniref:OmpH family outer membrane protein n=1 Tax=Winogradskyella ursingii TaxID=2686079 RepID=UPI0015CC0052|nr:OmpH family outer membrane protein [Winogradskyella ursingii]